MINLKVTLINAPYRDLYGPIKQAAGYYFPLGLGYIASYLRKNGHQIIFIDPESHGLSMSDIHNKLIQERSDLVGISCATPNFQYAIDLARMSKQVNNATVVIGGPHVSAMAEAIMSKYHDLIDVCVVGEGEYTMNELCTALGSKQSDLSGIKGIVYYKNGIVIKNKSREFIEDLDSLPFPARDLVDMGRYKPNAHFDIGKPSATIITSRGCPNFCTFCASHTTLGKKYRQHSPDYIIEEIKLLKNDYGIKYIIINDDTFTMNPKRVEEICNKILENDLKIEWYCFARVNTVSFDLLKLMKKAGLRIIGFGIESADEAILKRLKKGISLKRSIEVFHICNKLGLKTMAFFIFGAPGETKHTIQKTIDFAKRLDPTFAFFNMLIPYPGTELYQEFYRERPFPDDRWKDFVAIGINPVFDKGNLTLKEIQKFIYKANIAFFARPTKLFDIVSKIRSISELKTYIVGGLGLFKQILAWRKGSLRTLEIGDPGDLQ